MACAQEGFIVCCPLMGDAGGKEGFVLLVHARVVVGVARENASCVCSAEVAKETNFRCCTGECGLCVWRAEYAIPCRGCCCPQKHRQIHATWCHCKGMLMLVSACHKGVLALSCYESCRLLEHGLRLMVCDVSARTGQGEGLSVIAGAVFRVFLSSCCCKKR